MSDQEMKTDQSIWKNREQEPLPNSFCRKCGASLSAGARFCGICGAPVDVDSSGQESGQELQQFAESAKAVAKAGMDSACKNFAKGLGAAGEKISSTAERMRQDKQGNDDSSERDRGGNPAKAVPESVGKLKGIWKKATGIMSAVIFVLILINLFSRDPVEDIKDLVFDQYGSQTLGEAVETSVPEASWDSVKLGDKHYTVTVSGFCPDMSSNILIELDVNYVRSNVYGRVVRVRVDGEYYDDIFTIALVMGYIY